MFQCRSYMFSSQKPIMKCVRKRQKPRPLSYKDWILCKLQMITQLLQSKGPLKDKAAWCSHFYLPPSCWNHVYWFAFSPLDTTSTHLWPKLAPTEHKGGLCWFSRLFPTAGSSLCQFLLPAWYWQVTQIPLFQISIFSRRAVKTTPTRWLISKTLLQLQLLQLWFLSELINWSLCTAETFNFTEILSSHL